MEKFTVHTGTAVPLRRSDIDTDQIIPGRFCMTPARTGYADALFADWRPDPDFPLSDPAYRGATTLVAGDNFGTGSSREAAVWALQDFGFRAVIAPRFGDIFQTNALTAGLLPVTLPVGTVGRLWDLIESAPSIPMTLDLERQKISCGSVSERFTVDADSRARLLEGLDFIAATLRYEQAITVYEEGRRPALPGTISGPGRL